MKKDLWRTFGIAKNHSLKVRKIQFSTVLGGKNILTLMVFHGYFLVFDQYIYYSSRIQNNIMEYLGAFQNILIKKCNFRKQYIHKNVHNGRHPKFGVIHIILKYLNNMILFELVRKPMECITDQSKINLKFCHFLQKNNFIWFCFFNIYNMQSNISP